MTHKTILCTLLKKDLPSLSFPPYPGAKGQRIMDQISQEAWNMWLQHQTMLINEHHLNLLDPKARAFLGDEMEKFLFGSGSEKPKGYTAPV
jgi:Fe-S cluster biosynthesis and repair protein YggX